MRALLIDNTIAEKTVRFIGKDEYLGIHGTFMPARRVDYIFKPGVPLSIDFWLACFLYYKYKGLQLVTWDYTPIDRKIIHGWSRQDAIRFICKFQIFSYREAMGMKNDRLYFVATLLRGVAPNDSFYFHRKDLDAPESPNPESVEILKSRMNIIGVFR